MSDWREYERRSGGQIKVAAWRAMHRPCVAFEELAMDEANAALRLKLGASKVGGEPDLPLEFPWPSVDGQPLLFVAQFDLREINDAAYREPDFRTAFALPSTGLLSLFCDPVSATVRVHHFSGELQRQVAKGGAAPECFVRAVLAPSLALPSLSDARFEDLTSTAQTWLAELYGKDGRTEDVARLGQLGGYCDAPLAADDVCFFAHATASETFVARRGALHLREGIRCVRPAQTSLVHRFRNLCARHGDEAVRSQLVALGASPEEAAEGQFFALLDQRAERARTRGRETLCARLASEPTRGNPRDDIVASPLCAPRTP